MQPKVQQPRSHTKRSLRRAGRLLGRISLVATGLTALLLPTVATPAQAVTAPDSTTVQLLTINDFHGHIEAAPSQWPGIAGAAVLAGAVSELRAKHPATIFASAGDNVGASTFTSFIADDAPTIDALAQAGLDVSAVGNHEFDRGIADLTNRVLPQFGDRTGTDGGQYGLGANVRDEATGAPLLKEYEIVERAGIRIGFIGTVTEQTAMAVNPGLIEGVEFTSQLAAANRVAAEIDDRVDATVLLAHDGFASDSCAAAASEQSTFATLAREATPLIDAVVSAHTHQAYECTIADRPVIQTGYYGAALGKLLFDFDTAGDTAALTGVSTELVKLADATTGATLFAADTSVEAIVSAAVTDAEARGQEPVGRISADILRGGTPPGSDRGVESSLGNLIADITQQSVTGADIGVMNAGGLRDDLVFREAGTVTYRDVANVQPFANTIMSVSLTGTQIKQMLEQQWTVSEGNEQKRHLSVSESLRYTYLPEAPLGSRVTSITLDGSPINPDENYTVATISFLANGGDGLSIFQSGSQHADTGLNDLEMTINYFRAATAAGITVEPPAVGRAVVDTSVPEPQPDDPAPVPDDPDPSPDPDGSPRPDSADADDHRGEVDPGYDPNTDAVSGADGHATNASTRESRESPSTPLKQLASTGAPANISLPLAAVLFMAAGISCVAMRSRRLG